MSEENEKTGKTEKQIGPTFSRLPAAIVLDRRVTHAMRTVASGIGLFADQHGLAYPSIETLAANLGMDRRDVQRAIASLKALGHLNVFNVHSRGVDHKQYHLKYPPVKLKKAEKRTGKRKGNAGGGSGPHPHEAEGVGLVPTPQSPESDRRTIVESSGGGGSGVHEGVGLAYTGGGSGPRPGGGSGPALTAYPISPSNQPNGQPRPATTTIRRNFNKPIEYTEQERQWMKWMEEANALSHERYLLCLKEWSKSQDGEDWKWPPVE